MKKSLILLFSLCFVCRLPAKDRFLDDGALKSLSVPGFAENKGQVRDPYGRHHPEVKFVYHQGNMKIFLTDKGLIYQMERSAGMHQNNWLKESPAKKQELLPIETFRMDLILEGANTNAVIEKFDEVDFRSNYYQYDVLDVLHYNTITYREIYPGIDWTIYLENGSLKYDFWVKPGADPSVIKLKFQHHENIRINDDGSFSLGNRLGTLTEQAPLSYQVKGIIKTNYELHGNVISFKIGDYDKKTMLRVDPAISWITYFGDATYQGASDCSADNAGNLFVCGRTSLSNVLAFSGYQNNFGGGNYDAFLVKLSSAGSPLWATFFGGDQLDEGYACKSDGSGNVYLAGQTQSSIGIASGGHQNTASGSGDAFLAKFGSTGNLIWSTYYGGNKSDYARSLSIDAAGDVYLAGSTLSANNISFNGHQNSITSLIAYDAFLVKFNSAGSRQWATYFGGGGTEDWVNCEATANAVYISGYTSSNSNLAIGGFQTVFGGGTNDGFIAKFSLAGVFDWSSYKGGSGDEGIYDLHIDPAGNIVAGGYTTSQNNISLNGHQNSYGGGPSDAFVMKASATGSLVWASYYGGTDEDDGRGITTDPVGNIYITGSSKSTSNISFNGFQNTIGGGRDNFMAKFNPSGLRLWASYHGGPGDEYMGAIRSNQAGNIYICGETNSAVGIAYNSSQTSGGGVDCFIGKFCGGLDVTLATSDSIICAGESVTLSATGAASYLWLPSGTGNSITVQPSATTIYTVEFADANGCDANATITQNVSACNSIREVPVAKVQVYPNPTTGACTIITEDLSQLLITDALGRNCGSYTLVAGENKLELEHLPAGIYFLRFLQHNSVQNISLLIQ